MSFVRYDYSVRVNNEDQGTFGPLNRRTDEQWWDIRSSLQDSECYNGELRRGAPPTKYDLQNS